MDAVTIWPKQAKAKLDAGEAVLLDVTSSLVWPAVTHRIPGSVRVLPEPVIRALDSARPATEILPRFDGLSPGQSVIAYCT